MSKPITLLFFSFALIATAAAQMSNPMEPVDEATNSSVRTFFKQFETLYNRHQAHILASYFAEDGDWKTPNGNFTGPEAIEKRMNEFDFKHWHARDEVITVNEVRAPVGGAMLIAVGNWTNTVQEDGGKPIALHGWWNAMLLPDGSGSWSIVSNASGIGDK